MKVAVLPFDMSSPGDGAGLRRALGRLALDEVLRLAVVAKIEGTATLNDVSRSHSRVNRANQREGCLQERK